jgi:8-oxo-dGTP diphosphatase
MPFFGFIVMIPHLEVAAAVLINAAGAFLLAQRPPGKPWAGYWEFPGGKVEAGESLREALDRELHEELGVAVLDAQRWITPVFTYPHARVRLSFFRVSTWRGEPIPREGQSLIWVKPDEMAPGPILPANAPILKALSLPPIYGISHAEALGVDAFLARLEAALATGLRLVQVRDKTLPDASRLALAQETVRRAHAHGARVLINGPLALSETVGADGVHLDAHALAQLTRRPECAWVGASCHDAPELQRAAALGVDFAMLSPVLPTQTHPGAATLGWAEFARLAAGSPVPVYGLGGLAREDVALAQHHGAHGIALLRGAWA